MFERLGEVSLITILIFITIPIIIIVILIIIIMTIITMIITRLLRRVNGTSLVRMTMRNCLRSSGGFLSRWICICICTDGRDKSQL